MTPLASFRTPISRWMSRRGLNGDLATVTLSDRLITIEGDVGGVIQIPFADIARVRPGMFETKYKVYWSSWIWPRDGGRRFELAGDHDRPAYDAFMRRAAALMLDDGTIRVETGSGYFLAGYLMAAFGALTAVMAALVWKFWKDGDDWVPMLIPLSVPLSLLVLFAVASWFRYLPRRVTDLSQIGRGLPFGRLEPRPPL